MVSRRVVRENVVQLLYTGLLSDKLEGLKESLEDTQWICQEAQWFHYHKTAAKAILHLSSSYKQLHGKITFKASEILTFLVTKNEKESVEICKQFILAEESWLSTLKQIKNVDSSNAEDALRALSPLVKEAFTQLSKIGSSRLKMLKVKCISAHQKNTFNSLRVAIEKTLNQAANILSLTVSEAEIEPSKMLKELGVIEQQKKEAFEYITKIEAKQSEIAAKVNEQISNYSEDRVNLLDKSILFLGAYEILFDKDIPNAVSISECIEIAKEFSTNESHRFVHAVLDGIQNRD